MDPPKTFIQWVKSVVDNPDDLETIKAFAKFINGHALSLEGHLQEIDAPVKVIADVKQAYPVLFPLGK